LLVVERGGVYVILNANLFKLRFIIGAKGAPAHGLLVLLLISLKVVDSQFGLRYVLDVLVEIEADLYLQLLEGRHQCPFPRNRQLVRVRAKYVDIE